MVYGISEEQFWNMTIAELSNEINAIKKRRELAARQTAIDNYKLADLIGRSVSRCFSSKNTMPEIAEVYPNLFESAEIQEEKQRKKEELSALRFIHFAQSHNQKFHREEEQKVNE